MTVYLSKDNLSVKFGPNSLILTISTDTNLDLLFDLFKFIILDSTWVVESVYKVSFGQHSEIHRKKIPGLQNLKDQNLGEFIELIREGFSVRTPGSPGYEYTPISAFELRTRLPVNTANFLKFIRAKGLTFEVFESNYA